uniref:Uncharacterized protein n=1 Tax=Romanomermis culicivorax TaxID=13658 RepID=A0A915HR12_ROMCU
MSAPKIGGIQVSQSNIRSVLSITLKVNKKEYCHNLRKWTGDGFHYSIHQPTKPIPLYVFSHFQLKLHAGYMFNVAIKITNIIRHTAHFGRCVNRYIMLPEIGSSGIPFDKSVCLVSCLAKLIYLECRCFTRAIHSLDTLFSIENVDLDYINMSTPWCRTSSELNDCDSKHIMLMNTDEFMPTNCPRCLPICVESEYTATITSKKLRSIPENVKIDSSVNDLIVANFFTDSSLVTTIYENPAFTTEDFIIYIGSVFNLFFGLSYIAIWEAINSVCIA